MELLALSIRDFRGGVEGAVGVEDPAVGSGREVDVSGASGRVDTGAVASVGDAGVDSWIVVELLVLRGTIDFWCQDW